MLTGLVSVPRTPRSRFGVSAQMIITSHTGETRDELKPKLGPCIIGEYTGTSCQHCACAGEPLRVRQDTVSIHR